MYRLLIPLIAAMAVGLMGLTGCAFRMTVTPIQSEELVQKSFTNQFYDWLFKKDEVKS